MSAMSWSVSDVGDAAHRRVLALALLVGVERGDDVLGALARRSSAPCRSRGSSPGSPGCRGSRCTSPPSSRRPWRPAPGAAVRTAPKRRPGGRRAWQSGDCFMARMRWRAVGRKPAIIGGALILTRPPLAHAPPMKFQGSDNYVATPDLMLAVNAAITLQAPAAGQGRARHRQDDAGRGSGRGARHAAAAVAHQEHHQGAAGPVRVRRGEPAARQPARLDDASASRTSTTTSSRACCGRPSRAEQPVALLIDEIDKADIEFPNDLLRETRPHGVLRLRDARAGQGDAPAARSSSPRTTRRSCPTRSCAAASSTTSSSPTPTRCSASSTCTSPA